MMSLGLVLRSLKKMAAELSSFATYQRLLAFDLSLLEDELSSLDF